jgi:uncharacterized membrane protein YczE
MSISLTLEAMVGEDPWDVLAAAIRIAQQLDVTVTLELNGVMLAASANTRIDELKAEYERRL